MTLLLTSSPFISGTCQLNADYGFVRRLMACMPSVVHALFVASNPDDISGTEHWAQEMGHCLKLAGCNIRCSHVLHHGTAQRAAELVRQANFILLSGGHVPTQNAFFQRIRLREALHTWDGLLMGISAGSMNCASTVYSLPEEEGEAVDPFYHRFLPGLGLTDTQIIPHFQRLRETCLDGLRSIDDLACGDSFGRTLYGLPDGAYIYRRGTREELHGPAWAIRDGLIRKANHADEVLLIKE